MQPTEIVKSGLPTPKELNVEVGFDFKYKVLMFNSFGVVTHLIFTRRFHLRLFTFNPFRIVKTGKLCELRVETAQFRRNPVGMADIVAVDFNTRLLIKSCLLSSVGTAHISVIKCTVPTELNKKGALFYGGLISTATISAIPTGFLVRFNA